MENEQINLCSPFFRRVRGSMILACVANEISYFIEVRVFFVIQYGTATVQFRLWG